MSALVRHPAFFLAVSGAISALLGSHFNHGNYGAAPHLGVYLVMTGLWFGLAIGLGVWWFRQASPKGAISIMLMTWVAWEMAVNVAMQIDGPLFEATGPSLLKSCFAGFVAGAVGAAVTWAGAAAFVASLRTKFAGTSVVAAGALLGLLLPATNYFDGGAILLVPWQSTVAGLLGLNMLELGGRSSSSRVVLATGG